MGNYPWIHWIWVWLAQGEGLDVLKKRIFLAPTGFRNPERWTLSLLIIPTTLSWTTKMLPNCILPVLKFYCNCFTACWIWSLLTKGRLDHQVLHVYFVHYIRSTTAFPTVPFKSKHTCAPHLHFSHYVYKRVITTSVFRWTCTERWLPSWRRIQR